VRDACLVGPAYEVDTNDLFEQWKSWCDDEGRVRAGTTAVFVRDLSAAVPGLKPVRPRRGGGRARLLRGIDLATNHSDPNLTADDSLTTATPATTTRTTATTSSISVNDARNPGPSGPIPSSGSVKSRLHPSSTSMRVVQDGPGSTALQTQPPAANN